jgi:hypothetical protein
MSTSFTINKIARHLPPFKNEPRRIEIRREKEIARQREIYKSSKYVNSKHLETKVFSFKRCKIKLFPSSYFSGVQCKMLLRFR